MLGEAHFHRNVEGHGVLHLGEVLDDGNRLVDRLVRAATTTATAMMTKTTTTASIRMASRKPITEALYHRAAPRVRHVLR